MILREIFFLIFGCYVFKPFGMIECLKTYASFGKNMVAVQKKIIL